MAKEVTTRLIDDLAKKAGHRIEAAQTVAFGYDGTNYTIDLSSQNAAAFWAAVRPFVEAAEVIRGGGKRKATTSKEATAAPKAATAGKPKQDKDRTEAIREWARRNSYTIGDRGRIPGEVVEAYEKAGSPDLETVRAMPVPESAVASVRVTEDEGEDRPAQAEQATEEAPPLITEAQPQTDFVTTG